MLDNNDEKKFNSAIEWQYDYVADSLFINVVKKYNYKESVEITDDIILDIDETNRPVALEILDASKVFNLNKIHVKQLKSVNAAIKITEETICINAGFYFLVHQKPIPIPLNEEIPNEEGLPIHEIKFDTAATAK